MFSCKFAAYFQNTFIEEHLWRTSSIYTDNSAILSSLHRLTDAVAALAAKSNRPVTVVQQPQPVVQPTLTADANYGPTIGDLVAALQATQPAVIQPGIKNNSRTSYFL